MIQAKTISWKMGVSVLLLFCLSLNLNSSFGSIKSYAKISDSEGGFSGTLDDGDLFGASALNIGDLDKDGVDDLAVGAQMDNDGGVAYGAVWILFMNTDGTVKGHQKISELEGGFSGQLSILSSFGASLDSLGDLDDDGVTDLIVGAPGDTENGQGRGAVWIIFLNSDGTVKTHQKINETHGGLSATLSDNDQLGTAVAGLGDIDGDGIPDAAIGSESTDGAGSKRGLVWILFLNIDGTVKAQQKISDVSGGGPPLANFDRFGKGLSGIGDLDGDGISELAVGAKDDDDGEPQQGAVYIIFLSSTGIVKSFQKISETSGNFSGELDPFEGFGASLGAPGDLNGDLIPDLLVGLPGEDDGGDARGALWIIFLNYDGTVKGHEKVSDTQGGFSGTLDDGDSFGRYVAYGGDINNDGIPDYLVCAPNDDDGGENRGAVWIINRVGAPSLCTVNYVGKISELVGNFDVDLQQGDGWGRCVSQLGDFDGDGIMDFIVGDPQNDDGAYSAGAIWIMLLNTNGSLKNYQKISDTEGTFYGLLDQLDQFGRSVCPIGDFDKDGITDLAVGAPGDEDGGSSRGAVWLLYLRANGTVREFKKISATEGNFTDAPTTGTIKTTDEFGRSVALLGDMDGDGVQDIAVGADKDDDGGDGYGAVWILYLNADGTVKKKAKISQTEGNFSDTLGVQDNFGSALASPGDLDLDGVPDLIVSAPFHATEGDFLGAIWVLFLNADGSVKSHTKIGLNKGGFAGDLDPIDVFGSDISIVDDFNLDGIPDLAVGAVGDDDGGGDFFGAVWILYLNRDGTVKGHNKISATHGGFPDELDAEDRFGNGLAFIGDINDDSVPDMVVGAPLDDDSDGPFGQGVNTGAVYVITLNGTALPLSVHDEKNLDAFSTNLSGLLDKEDQFGYSSIPIGDVDGDGVPDVAVGSPFDDDGGEDRGAVWFLMLNKDGSVKSTKKISDAEGGFSGILTNISAFGISLANLGDLNNDGMFDIAVGALNDNAGGSFRGAVWILFLNPDLTVKSYQKIAQSSGSFNGTLDDFDFFSSSLLAPGDINDDGDPELVIGAMLDNDGGNNEGSIWILTLNTDGTVKSHTKISASSGGFSGDISASTSWGSSLASPGDLDNDGNLELLVGAQFDKDGGENAGALWLLFMNDNNTVKSHKKISALTLGFQGVLNEDDNFGSAVNVIKDIDGDDVPEIIAGASGDDDGDNSSTSNSGAVWIIYINSDGSIKRYQKISESLGAMKSAIGNKSIFGSSISPLGDVNGDGVDDLLIGARGDDTGGLNTGSVWVTMMNARPRKVQFQLRDMDSLNNADPWQFTNSNDVVVELDKPCSPALTLYTYVEDTAYPMISTCDLETTFALTLVGVDGERTAWIDARNIYGYSGKITDTIILDTAAPTSSATAPTGDVIESPAPIPVEYTSEDSSSGIQNINLWWQKDGGGYTLLTGTFTTSPVLFDSSSSGGTGSYDMYTVALDNAGNMESSPGSPDITFELIESIGMYWMLR